MVLSFLALSIIELFSRLVLFPNWRDLSHPRFVKHPIYGSLQKSNLKIRRFNPNNYDVINTTNSMGFRDREIGFTEDLKGIWIAGASNAYGGFIEDGKIFPSLLQ